MKTILTIALFLSSLLSFAQFPALEWVSQATGNQTVFALASVSDSQGNVYSTGAFAGTADFDPSSGVTNLVSEGELDVFISKHTAQGNLVWALPIGSYSNDRANSLALDANGNIYIVGTFFSTVDFDPGIGVQNGIGISLSNFFVLKLSNDGEFVWVKTFSVNDLTLAEKVTTDNTGNIVIAGYFQGSMTFATSSGDTTLLSNNNGAEIFIMKMDSEGEYIWSQLIGGPNRDVANALCSDINDNVYVTGYFQGSVDFDVSSEESLFISNSSANSDAFVLKLTSSGEFVWAKNMGGEFSDFGSVIAVDQQGNVFSGGSYQTVADMDPSDEELLFTSLGSYDLYVHKLGPDGEFMWCGSVGGTESDNLKSITIDATGSVYYLGTFKGTADLNPGSENLSIASNGLDDNFILKMDNSGPLSWAKTIGGSQTDAAYSIHIGANESFYVSGAFRGTCDFDINEGATSLTSAGESDLFIAKYAQNSVGMFTLSSENDFSVFPNPCAELINIQVINEIDALSYELYSITGQVIEKAKMNKGLNTINTFEVPKGVYFLIIKSKSESLIAQKIVKI